MSKAKRDKQTYFLAWGILVVLLVGFTFIGWAVYKGSVTEKAVGGAGGTAPAAGGEKIRTGEAAALSITPIDIAGNSMTSKTDVNISVYQADRSNSPIVRYTSYSATADGDVTTGIVTGKTYKIYAIDSSYVFMEDDVVSVTVDEAREPVDVYVHTRVAESNLQFKCYDPDTGSELDAAADTSKADYNLSLGADQVKTIECRLSVNTADKAIAVGAIGVLYQNDVEDVKLLSVQARDVSGTAPLVSKNYYLKPATSYKFKTGAVPKHMKSLTFDSSLVKGSAWNDIYMLEDHPVLREWETLSIKFSVDTSSTDPTYATDSTADLLCLIVKDWAPYESKDRSVKWGIADDTDSQADVGLDETDNSPQGKQSGVCIQVI